MIEYVNACSRAIQYLAEKNQLYAPANHKLAKNVNNIIKNPVFACY